MSAIQKDTRDDKLRIGTPFWIKTPHSTIKPSRKDKVQAFDAIVVGSGISGALIAEALSRQGKRVLILDRRPPVRGSTPASTAMIQHEIDVPLSRLRKKIGKSAADRAWLRSQKAVYDLIDLVKDLDIACQMQQKPALYLAGNELGAKALAAEAKARSEIGIDVTYLGAAELNDLFGLKREAALYSPASASGNPAQLTAGLLEAAVLRGSVLFSPVEVMDFTENDNAAAISTSDGWTYIADHLIFCTGYEHLKKMYSKSHHVTSTWALASKPLTDLPQWMHETIVWEASDPYLYFRTDEHGRLIIGGEDEESSESNSDPDKLDKKAKTIIAKFESLTGVKIGRADYKWAAPFSVTDDGLPIVDRVPDYRRVFTIMGFGGNGITFSMIGAQIITAMIAGAEDPDAEIFRFR